MLDAAQRETGLSGQKARDLLGGFLFSGADVEKSLSDISGGEQRRLSLAILVASGANVLILDEPTNHLDIESREALEDALSAFEGAVILVSHDRALLEAVGTRTLVCEDGELSSYTHGWATYQRDRDQASRSRLRLSRCGQARAQSEQAAQPPGRKPSAPRARRVAWRRRSRRPRRSCAQVEEELSDPAAWATAAKSERASERHEAAKRKLAELYEQWEAAEQAGQRSGRSSLTRVPRPGARVMLRTLTLSGLGSGALRSARSTNSRRTIRISYSAKAAPMQRRTPPPKGIQA